MRHSINITSEVKTAIENHARQSRPAECCGLLAGIGNLISAVHPLRNEAEHPETKYFAAPEEMFAAMRRMRQTGQEMLGIYHSHPRTAAYPSPTDVEMAFYPEAVYFIISLASGLELRAFKIHTSQIEEVHYGVVESA